MKTLNNSAERSFAICAIAVAILLHLSTTVLLSIALDFREDWEPMTNVRLFSQEGRAVVAEGYLREQWGRSAKPKLVVLGDSQMRSHKLHPSHAWTQHLQDELPNYDVINLAFADARWPDSLRLMHMMEDNGFKAEVLIQNLNLSHFRSDSTPATTHLGDGRPVERRLPAPMRIFIGKTLTAASWNLWDVQEFIRKEILFPLRAAPSFVPFTAKRYEDNYITVHHLDGYRPVVEEFARRAPRVARRTIVLPALREPAMFDDPRFSKAAVQRDEGTVLSWLAGASDVDVADVGDGLLREHFIDVVHLSDAGGLLLARRVASLVRAKAAP